MELLHPFNLFHELNYVNHKFYSRFLAEENTNVINLNDVIRANAQQPKLFVGMILILIFAEALALYGLIVGIILSSRAGQSRVD